MHAKTRNLLKFVGVPQTPEPVCEYIAGISFFECYYSARS